MNISINIVLYFLHQTHPEAVIQQNYWRTDRYFSAVRLFTLPCLEAPKPETLYVVPDPAVLVGRDVPETLCLLYAAPAPVDLPGVRAAVLYVSDSAPLDLFNSVSGWFERLNRWDAGLQLTLAQQKEIQAFLDLSEPLIRHDVCVWNPTFTLLAFLKKGVTHSSTVAMLTERGYLKPDLIKPFVKSGASPSFAKLALRRPPTISGENEIIRTFELRGKLVATLAMFIGDEDPETGYLELIEHLTDVIQNHLSARISEQYLPADRLLVDMLDGRAGSPEEVRDKLSTFSIPYTGTFFFACFQLASDNPALLAITQEQLRRNVASSHVFRYRGMLCVLGKSATASQMNTSVNRQYLQAIEAYCGISNTFTSLERLSQAFDQARTALEFGKALHAAKGKRLFFYSRYYVYHILRRACFDPDGPDLGMHLLMDMMAEDRRTGNNNGELLRVYLESERNMTEAARRVNMHRNSLMYRIDRIRETLAPYDLDDPDVRLHLLLTFKLIELEAALLPKTRESVPDPK